jgi:hypothetical protein
MRIFELIDLEFRAKKVRTEERLENTINNNELDVADKVNNIIELFEVLSSIELAKEKYDSYMSKKK